MHAQEPAFEISDEPSVTWCGNGWKWQLDDPVSLRWAGSHHDCCFLIPIGFKTDFATVPRCLWWLFPSQGAYNRAAIIHDYLCEEPDTDRVFADAMFLVIMRRTGVPWFRWVPMYAAVRCYGAIQDTWRSLWGGKKTKTGDRPKSG